MNVLMPDSLVFFDSRHLKVSRMCSLNMSLSCEPGRRTWSNRTVVHALVSSSRRLGTHASEFTRADAAEGTEDLEHQRPKVNHSVRRCLDEDDAEGLDGKVLLVGEVSIHCDECIEGALHPTQKFAVLDTIPTKPVNGLGVMTAK